MLRGNDRLGGGAAFGHGVLDAAWNQAVADRLDTGAIADPRPRARAALADLDHGVRVQAGGRAARDAAQLDAAGVSAGEALKRQHLQSRLAETPQELGAALGGDR